MFVRSIAVGTCLVTLGLTFGGCSGGGGGGGGGASLSVGNASIDASLPTLKTSVLSGSSTLTGAITNGSISNPNSATASGSSTITLGGADDGTAASVNLQVSASSNADGSGSVSATVTEPGSGHTFLSATVSYDPVTVSVRVPPLGLSGIRADGTGQAFVIVRLGYSGRISRTFANQSPGGATLVDFGAIQPLPPASASGSFSGFREVLFEYRITQGANGLEARVQGWESGASEFVFSRSGGPAAAPLTHALSSVTVDGRSFSGADLVVPVGTDASATGASATGAVGFGLAVSGGVPNASFTTDVSGSLSPTVTDSALASLSYTGSLSGLTKVSDGSIDIGQSITIETDSDEDPTSGGSLKHTLDRQVNGFEDFEFDELEELLYLPSTSERRSRVFLFR